MPVLRSGTVCISAFAAGTISSLKDGTASVASWDPPPIGPRMERHLLVKRARVQGFLAFDYAHRYEEAIERLADWVRQGRLKYVEDILDGLESCPDAIAGRYRGDNQGKRLVRLYR